jgi:hypothetical protein
MACAHRGCKCPESNVKRGRKAFCSETCARIETTGRHEPKCPCGHKECSAERRPRA